METEITFAGSEPDFRQLVEGIIAISGFAMAEDSDRCIKAGADAFISKPCKMPELVSKIQQLISSRKKQL